MLPGVCARALRDWKTTVAMVPLIHNGKTFIFPSAKPVAYALATFC